MNYSFDPEVDDKEDEVHTETVKRAFRMRSRDRGDNKSRQHLQVDDLSKVTDDNTVWVWDFDGVPFKVCSSCQDTWIIAKHKETGEESKHKGSVEFKGLGKTPPTKSWLGRKNLERKANGLEPYTSDEFEITKHQGLKEGESLETIIDKIEAYIDDVTLQFGVKKFLFCLGSGDVFRHKLPLPDPYKGQRDPMKPVLLSEARKWIEDNLPCEIAPEGYECDDLVEWYAAEGFKAYKKTGKFSHALLAEDKDADSNPKLVANYSRGGVEFKAPKAMLIESTTTDVGCLELVPTKSSPKLVGTGLKWLCMQAFAIGDSADHYHPYNYLPDSYKKSIKYGGTTAYTDFLNLNTPKDVLQKCVDNFALWFPRGLQYTDCHGVDQDMDTFSYMSMNFTVAYMTRSQEDNTQLVNLLDYFKVDYKDLVGNNKLDQRPLVCEDDIISCIVELREGFKELRGKDSLTEYKSADSKPVLQQRLKDTEEKLIILEKQLDKFFKEV